MVSILSSNLRINPDKPDLEGGNNDLSTAFYLANIETYSKAFGLTIDSSADVDWYRFTLEDTGSASDQISVLLVDGGAIKFELFDADGSKSLAPMVRYSQILQTPICMKE